METKLAALVKPSFARLERVWSVLGLEGAARESRLNDVMKHLAALATSIADQEETSKEQIMANLTSYRYLLRKMIFFFFKCDFFKNEILHG